ncbi:hypothetical protein F3Y22_tig00110377pilonHSYRG00092 [Hibiscus syriacus]|uniref:DNA (Cytosine-5)-methyltransferase DRM1/2 n=1 Tax=Hibiscus syriacus TaxID=106335 RepID=A0A6A3AVC1_HIBSY|nr:hypothetical protein F3Y22_tig00110377pilonHSYRG00092 [Hibiscus syriacus]
MLILITNSSDYERIFQDDFTYIDSSSDTEEILNSDANEENKLLYLTKMEYSEAEALIIIEICGMDSSIAELTDFICVAQMAKAADAFLPVEDRKPLCNVPNYKKRQNSDNSKNTSRRCYWLPYFYFENVALAPVGVWTKMSRDAEVVLYQLSIPLKANVQELNGHQLEQLMSRFVEFDLIVAGIQCNNLTGRHKHHQDELEDFCWCISLQ